MEADYFTAKTAKGVYTVTARGEITFKDGKTNQSRQFKTTSFRDGQGYFIVHNLFIIERDADLTLISGISDGKERI